MKIIQVLPGKKSVVNTASKISLQLLFIFSLFTATTISAQVKIGNNPGTIDANSLLELESTNKGFLPPRVALTSTTSVSPLTGTVPAGMLVYSKDGTLPDGFYYWNGTAWKLVATSELNVVTKNADATLTKTETMVLASNDITLNLPEITSSDDGLAITVKNTGDYKDLVVVKGTSSAVIDDQDSSKLTRYCAQTFVASNGNWIIKEKGTKGDKIMDVGPNTSWTTIQEALEFLDEHMDGPMVLRLSAETYEIPATIVIDLPYSLTIEGASYGTSTVIPVSGIGNSPMFRCLTESYFKHLAFDGTALASYGNSSGQDAFQLEGDDEYYEIKDCTFDHFNKAVVLETNCELWMFEADIVNAVAAGIEVASASTNAVTLKISEVDFTSCAKGVNLLSGNNAVISILNSGFYNSGVGSVGVNYVPATFTNFSSMFITNNSWNDIGSFTSGFDFSLSSGRDAKAFLQNNAGDPDRSPRCYINVLNNSTGTSLPTNTQWYKATWNHAVSTVSTSKWTVSNTSGNVNRITYQPVNKKDGYFVISGSLSCNYGSQTISLGIVKKGVTTTRLGETTIRTANGGTSTLFSTTVYISNISKDDYFELYLFNGNAGSTITIQDLQWYADTK